MTIPVWLAALLCLLCVYLGAWIGMHMERLFPSRPKVDTRVCGPGLPTEEDEADAWMKREGW